VPDESQDFSTGQPGEVVTSLASSSHSELESNLSITREN
jgi:hypothetical protein